MISYFSRRTVVSAAVLSGFIVSALDGGSVTYAMNLYPPLPLWKTQGEEPFDHCDPRAFMVSTQTSTEAQLAFLDLTTSATEVVLAPAGPLQTGYTYNALAYNSQDDYLYAMKNGDHSGDATNLIRIGKDGLPRFVAILPEIRGAFSADFDDEGNYYVQSGRSLYKYKITDDGPVLVWDEPYESVTIADLVYHDGAIWSVQTDDFPDRTDAIVVRIALDGPDGYPSAPPVLREPFSFYPGLSFHMTSMFPSKNGIYGYDTMGGRLFRLNLPTDDLNDASLQHIASGDTAGGSDGAKCRNAPLGLPAEIFVEKTTASSAFVPGDAVSFTIRVENQGPHGASGITLQDPLPAGVISAAWTCTPSGENAVCPAESGTGPIDVVLALQEAGAYVTFEVTMETDPAATAEIINTATITVPEDFTDDPSNNTSTISLIPPRLELEKTGSWIDANDNGAPDVGEHVEFTFTVLNASPADLTNVVIEDPLVAAVTPASIETLHAGATAEFKALYPLTLEDTLAEKVVNTASATGTTGDSTMRSNDSTAEVPLPPPAPLIHTEKTAAFLDDIEPNDLPDVGERIEFRVKVQNKGNVTMVVFPPIDEGPTFNGAPLTGTMTPFTPEQHEIPRNEEREFVAYYHLTREDIDQVAGVENAVQNSVVTPASTPQDMARGTPPTRYELPEPAITTLPGYGLLKNAQVSQVMRGQQVPYTIKITPQQVTGPVTLVDRPPPGFVFLPGSARVDGRGQQPQIEGTSLRFDLDVQDELRIDYVLVATGSVSLGTYVNVAQVFQEGQLDKPISSIARDEVEVVPDPIFDCGDVMGTVFNDLNRNGYQDKGEPGMPGARVASVDGMLMTTDKHGRFNVACADLPNGRVGSTYIMKLDARSLPTGYRIISENPRTIRLTAGKISALNFATSIVRVVRLDVNDSAFLPGEIELLPEWDRELAKLVQTLEAEPSVLRLAYIDNAVERGLAGKRLSQLRSKIASTWKERSNRYRLEIEARMVVSPELATTVPDGPR